MLSILGDVSLASTEGSQIHFYSPFLNNDLQLEFKYCSDFPGYRYILNEKEKSIDLVKKGIVVHFPIRDDTKFKKCAEARSRILKDLKRVNSDFKSGKEPLLVFKLGYEDIPFLVTSESIMENGQFSRKYDKAVTYYMNAKARRKGKDINLSSVEESQEMFCEALKKVNLESFPKRTVGKEECYQVFIDQMVEIL